MLRRFRNFSLPGKVIWILIVVLIVGLLAGGQRASAIAGVAFILLVIAIVWWCVSQFSRRFRRRSHRNRAVQQLNALPAQNPTVSTLSPGPTSWEPPLQRSAHSPGIGDVLALTPSQFEEMSAGLLEGLGYTTVQRTGKSGDLGADITCRDPQGRSTIVQCKRYAPGSTIGTPVVQTFIGMMTVHHRVDRGLFIATVPFTQQAVDLARHHGVALIDGPALLLLLHLTGVPLYRQAASYPG